MLDFEGLVLLAIFYVIILVSGICLAKKSNSIEDLILSKNLPVLVGICTLVATEVGGAFINGTAEQVFNKGLIHCLAPICYSLSMTINAFVFVDKLRRQNCLTLIDSLQKAYGNVLGSLLYSPCCLGDVCWTASVLSSLGSSLKVMTGVNREAGIVSGASIAVLYTVLGGLSSVAVTDVVQFAFISAGLWISLPFISEAADFEALPAEEWIGSIPKEGYVNYLDEILVLICGGIPWQPYYQRALSMANGRQVKILSVTSTILCLISMIPPVIIGAAAKNALTNVTNTANVLPLAIDTFSPEWISRLALTAISAAVMSSVDSALLSGASYLAHNVFGVKSASILRICVIVLAVAAVLISFRVESVYGLWFFAADLGYVLVFPQFAASALTPDRVNAFGAVAASTVGLTLRLCLGEPGFGIPALMTLPGHLIPVKTVLMLCTTFTLYIVSYATMKCSYFYSSLSSLPTYS